MNRLILFPLVLAWLTAACTPATPSGGAGGSGPQAAPARPARPLVTALRVEPKTIAARGLGQNTGVALYLPKRMFNGDLAVLDGQGNPQPYLAEVLPQLGTDNWKVFPDGTMETTYHLKPDLVWHDGSSLTADDFVFSWQVYATPQLGSAASPPINLMQDVGAPDPRTVVIHWKQPYASAGALQSVGTGANGLPPLPRSILGSALESGSPDAMLNHPYWTSGFVGLGPYKLDRWEPGAFIEAVAFDRHVLGAAKIQRIKLVFMPDGNTTFASMLSGDVQLAADNALPPPQVAMLMQQWPPGTGSAVLYANQWRAAHFQHRSDFVNPPALQDPRVRKALAHAVDKPGIDELVYSGQFTIADSIFSPTSDLGKAADAALTKYPFDLQRTAQLMGEAGFARGGDGVYTSPSGGRFSAEVKTNGATDNEAEMSAVASGWRQAGFDFREAVLPAIQAQDTQARSVFPGLYIYSGNVGEGGITGWSSANIPRPENEWRGGSYDGYSSPDMDRLITAFTTALGVSDRINVAVEIAKVYSAELPSISLFFPTQPWVFTADLTGPKLVASEGNVAWNMQEWEFH
jgi:peptide/nickel transport system substrate-binding protein